LKKLKASLYILFLQLQLITDLVDLLMVQATKLE
jgi:hypothetical protein